MLNLIKVPALPLLSLHPQLLGGPRGPCLGRRCSIVRSSHPHGPVLSSYSLPQSAAITIGTAPRTAEWACDRRAPTSRQWFCDGGARERAAAAATWRVGAGQPGLCSAEEWRAAPGDDVGTGWERGGGERGQGRIGLFQERVAGRARCWQGSGGEARLETKMAVQATVQSGGQRQVAVRE